MRKKKILTFSYDDATLQDIRLIELFNKYNMKATFNINSECLGREEYLMREGVRVGHIKVNPEDVKHIYEGHEVAAHTLTHPALKNLSDEDVIREVEQDRINLSELCGYEVVGMADPCGSSHYTPYQAEVIRNNTGIKYARGTISCHNFDIQQDLLNFKPTVYHHGEMDKMFELGEKFLNLKTDKTQIFYVWGHSFEFDIHNSWDRFEEFLKMMANKDDISYCTNKEALLNL